MLKAGKAAGPDDIPAEALKADPNISWDILYDLFGKIWKGEEMPQDWLHFDTAKERSPPGVQELQRNILDIGGRQGTEQNYPSSSSGGCRCYSETSAGWLQEGPLLYRPDSRTQLG